MSRAEWVVFDAYTGYTLCTRCGVRLNLPLPQPVSIFVAATNAFVEIHENCDEKVLPAADADAEEEVEPH